MVIHKDILPVRFLNRMTAPENEVGAECPVFRMERPELFKVFTDTKRIIMDKQDDSAGTEGISGENAFSLHVNQDGAARSVTAKIHTPERPAADDDVFSPFNVPYVLSLKLPCSIYSLKQGSIFLRVKDIVEFIQITDMGSIPPFTLEPVSISAASSPQSTR